MSSDASELEALARDLAANSAKALKKTRAAVSKGSLNIKNAMRADARKSHSFKRMADTIDYDLEQTAASIRGTIGPNKDIQTRRGRPQRYNGKSAPGSAASLAGLAYYGGSKGGGGTVRDPEMALADEEPNFIKAIEDIAGEVL